MMCNFKTCLFEVFKVTSNLVNKIKNRICLTPNTLSIYLHNNFIEISTKSKYYIQKDNVLMTTTPLLTLTDELEIQKLTTDYFIPYIILYYDNRNINIELQDNEYTYYIVGNTINRDFIKFYLKQKLNIVMEDNDKYSLEFIDSEYKTIFLNDDSGIYFEKESYKII